MIRIVFLFYEGMTALDAIGPHEILSGIRATTHWAVMDRLKTWGAIPIEHRVVEDGKIITAAGVSAGLDMALVLTAKLAGQPLAETLQLGLLNMILHHLLTRVVLKKLILHW